MDSDLGFSVAERLGQFQAFLRQRRRAFGINSGVYGTLFYTMTGFHGAHVFGGGGGISIILLRFLNEPTALKESRKGAPKT